MSSSTNENSPKRNCSIEKANILIKGNVTNYDEDVRLENLPKKLKKDTGNGNAKQENESKSSAEVERIRYRTISRHAKIKDAKNLNEKHRSEVQGKPCIISSPQKNLNDEMISWESLPKKIEDGENVGKQQSEPKAVYEVKEVGSENLIEAKTDDKQNEHEKKKSGEQIKKTIYGDGRVDCENFSRVKDKENVDENKLSAGQANTRNSWRRLSFEERRHPLRNLSEEESKIFRYNECPTSAVLLKYAKKLTESFKE